MSRQACTSSFDQLHLKLNISTRPNTAKDLNWAEENLHPQDSFSRLKLEGRDRVVF